MKKKKTIVIVVILVLLGCIGLIGILFHVEREKIDFLYEQVVLKKKAFSVIRHTKDIEFESGGLTLRGTLYLPRGKGPFPGIVLTHGASSLGRKLEMYRILSYKLARRGYVVLSFDFRGFGDSEDPKKFVTPVDIDFVEDVRQAVLYLESREDVNVGDIHLIGHSFGGGVIIPAGLQEARVKTMVSISPARRTHELFWAENAPAKHFLRERLANAMKLPQLDKIPLDWLNPILQTMMIDTILEAPIHPPTLLVDGDLEDQEDLAFLREIFENMSEPKTYVTIHNATHYFGTRRDHEGFDNIVTYLPDVMKELVEVIDRWIRERRRTYA
jgi:alpha-beta hydrolase superfamily lysophospholipase